MSDVFPTLWSPRSTILLRFSGGEEKSADAGVPAEDMVESELAKECARSRLNGGR